jgi:transcriptional regulator
MYLPDHFEEARDEELLRTIAACPLGALVVHGPHGLDANHVPFLIDESGAGPKKLLAHVARANPMWKEARDGDEALVIFRADNAYISPNWYPSKHEFHKQVPTWNCRVVHVHGKLLIRGEQEISGAMLGTVAGKS